MFGLPLLICWLALLSGDGVLNTDDTTADETNVDVDDEEDCPLRGGGESFRVSRLRGLVRVGSSSLESGICVKYLNTELRVNKK